MSREIVKTDMLERDEIDRTLELAVLTGEHVLLAGSPGTAKSMQAERFFQHFPSAKTFNVQLTKFSTEDQVFGPLNIQKLKEGEFEYLYQNTILDSHFAFIDEMFDASDVLLRSLLSVLNERRLQKGSFAVQCPLITAIATANYTRMNEVTDALVDRFLFQMEVKPLQYKDSLIGFQEKFTPEIKWNLKNLRTCQNEVSKVVFPEDVKPVFLDVVNDLGFTDRRIVKAVNVMKAHAFMDYRETVKFDDLKSLSYITQLNNRKSVDMDVIANSIREFTIKAEQKEQLEGYANAWGRVEGESYDAEHLAEENRILQSLMEFDAYDEDVAQARDNMYNDFKDHFDESKEIFLRRNGLD